jgi:voltage-gated potassium channel
MADSDQKLPQSYSTPSYIILYNRIKQRVFELLHEEFQKPNDRWAKFVVRFITSLIVLNVVAIVLESIPILAEEYEEFFWNFEVFSIVIFTIEYSCSVWTVNNNHEYAGLIKGRIKYVLSVMGLIDLLAILPFYIHVISPLLYWLDLRVLRIFRMFRIFHLFTLNHYSDAFKTIGNVLKEKKESLFITVFIGAVILIFCSILIYDLEVAANEHEFSDLFQAMYWVGITLARLKQGDIYPVTPGGQVIAGFVEIMGIMFFILPTGIIASGFISHIRHDHAIPKVSHQKKEKSSENHAELLKDVSSPSKYQETQSRTYHLLEIHHEKDKYGRLVGTSIGILIILNLFAAMFETIADLPLEYYLMLKNFEGVSVIIFTIEYFFRIWSCNWRDIDYLKKPISGRIRFMVQPLSLIDLLAILPFYLPMFFTFEITFIRVFRLFRFMRLFKLGRFSQSLESIKGVFRDSKASLMVSFFIASVFWIFVSTLIYHFENEVHPDQFHSIPETMWWLILSFTSYGGSQSIPVTIVGRLLSVVAGFIGMSLLALPTGILGAAFVEELDHHELITEREVSP